MSELQYTPIEDIPAYVDELHQSFRAKKNHSIQQRLNYLRNLYFSLIDNIEPMCEALQKDFNRSPSETKNIEFVPLIAELLNIMKYLNYWLKPKNVYPKPFSSSTAEIYTEKTPLGVICIISPFNYPLSLAISPIIGSIASGNVVIFKPSEFTPNFTLVLSDILQKSLNSSIFKIVIGGIEETTALLEEKYDKIVYTGNATVGKIVSRKAAENLTPVLLELGGKSPVFITPNTKLTDLETIARRVAWGKFTNGGQTCIGVDYVICHESLIKKFAAVIKRIIEDEFYPYLSDKNAEIEAESHPNYTHIIHGRAYERLIDIINKSKGVLVTGGGNNKEKRFIEPTVLNFVEWDDSTMEDELFGPILPIMSYSDLEDVLKEVVEHHDTPLALYIFSNDTKEQELISSTIRSGSVCLNDCLIQGGVYSAPFGGVGSSGNGAYHSQYSINSFTHERFVMRQPMWNDFILKLRYFSTPKNDILMRKTFLGNDGVWFDRDGNVNVGGPNILWSFWAGICGLFSLIWSFMF